MHQNFKRKLNCESGGKNMQKIRFSDLSGALKALVILSWACDALVAAAFLLGFIEGLVW